MKTRSKKGDYNVHPYDQGQMYRRKRTLERETKRAEGSLATRKTKVIPNLQSLKLAGASVKPMSKPKA